MYMYVCKRCILLSSGETLLAHIVFATGTDKMQVWAVSCQQNQKKTKRRRQEGYNIDALT